MGATILRSIWTSGPNIQSSTEVFGPLVLQAAISEIGWTAESLKCCYEA